MMYFTSDMHFFHKNIIKYCNRPFDTVEEMNESYIQLWNDKVRCTDMIYYLGDFAFANAGKIKTLLSNLNGFKILIKGNHDFAYSDAKWLEFGFQEVYNNYYLIDDRILLSHFPYADVSSDDRYLSYRPEDNGQCLLLHGHVHSSPNSKLRRSALGSLCLDVGIDANNSILSFEDVLDVTNNFII